LTRNLEHVNELLDSGFRQNDRIGKEFAHKKRSPDDCELQPWGIASEDSDYADFRLTLMSPFLLSNEMIV